MNNDIKAGRMNVKVDSNRFGFDSDQITFKEAVREATVLVGKREKKLTIGTEGNVLHSCTSRSTPVGEAIDYTWRRENSEGLTLAWTLSCLDHLSAITLRASVTNGTEDNVRLKEIVLARSSDDSLCCDGDPSAWLLSPISHDKRVGHLGQTLTSANEDTIEFWKSMNAAVPFKLPTEERFIDGRWRSYKDFVTLYTEAGEIGLTMGAVGEPEADVRFDCKVNNGKMRLDIISEMSDVRIEPGETRHSQEVMILARPYDEAVDTLFKWLSTTHGSRTHQGAKYGWCSWYDLRWDITEDTIAATVQQFNKRKDRTPVQVIQIDNGFEKKVGDWRCNDKFSGGWAPLVHKIREAGAEPGIWLAPLAMHDSLGYLGEHPDWFQRNAIGELELGDDTWGATTHWLDPTHPEVQTFMRDIVRDHRREGFTYYKTDYNTISDNCRFYDSKKTRLQAYRTFYRLLREEIGEEDYLLACSGFTRGIMGFADACRIGPDSVDVWSTAHTPCTILEAIRATGKTAAANGIFFANDPDVTYTMIRPQSSVKRTPMEVGDSLTLEEWRTWHGFAGLLGGMQFISDPLEKPVYANAWRSFEILTPPAPERAQSLHAGTDLNHQRFGFVANREWGSFASLLLWNAEDEGASIALNSNRLDRLGESYHIWSFWDETYYGIGDSSFVTPLLQPHASLLLRFTPCYVSDERPVLIGSTLHISMGASEISGITSTNHTLDILLNDGGASDGKLFVYSKQPLVLQSAEGCTVEGIKEVEEFVWSIHLASRQRGRNQACHLLF
ncbi:glycoside hydrolase family 36 protein [Cohnella silvisoli]|uniref:Alpha-galactosidase n=1 Tax=Cohnella silvisoli TaxID=2873699 RepID=A0ABV1KYZ4_9BACL|nr:glycoside hydrolase family 36 protein [Cohnella silvisoli]MCD9021907.1 alpha-galactosidase [Cohnella silvisoli]